jgi:hypothetical protein
MCSGQRMRYHGRVSEGSTTPSRARTGAWQRLQRPSYGFRLAIRLSGWRYRGSTGDIVSPGVCGQASIGRPSRVRSWINSSNTGSPMTNAIGTARVTGSLAPRSDVFPRAVLAVMFAPVHARRERLAACDVPTDVRMLGALDLAGPGDRVSPACMSRSCRSPPIGGRSPPRPDSGSAGDGEGPSVGGQLNS